MSWNKFKLGLLAFTALSTQVFAADVFSYDDYMNAISDSSVNEIVLQSDIYAQGSLGMPYADSYVFYGDWYNGLSIEYGKLNIDGVGFSQFYRHNGGALYIKSYAYDDQPVVTEKIANSFFANNEAQYFGGAIYNKANS